MYGEAERLRPCKAQISVDHPYSLDSRTEYFGIPFTPQHPVSSANCKSRSLVTVIVWLPIDLHHVVGVQSSSRSHHADRGETYEKPTPTSEEKGRKTE